VADVEYAGTISMITRIEPSDEDTDICPKMGELLPKTTIGLIAPNIAIQLGKQDLEGFVAKFITEFEKLSGRELMIYTSAGFWNSYMPLTSWAKYKKLWVANYTTAAEPLMPNDWEPKKNPGKYPYKLWQKLADKDGLGAKYGAQSRDIDINFSYGDAVWFKETFGVEPLPELAPPPPPPPPVPVPTMYKVISVGWANLRDADGRDIGDIKTGSTVIPVGEDDTRIHVDGWLNKGSVKKV
jgi:hypothetical protein